MVGAKRERKTNMPLFVCDKCHAIDNSACGGNYWDRLLEKDESKFVVQCAECYTGTWHGHFPKRIYVKGDEKRDGGIDYIPKDLR